MPRRRYHLMVGALVGAAALCYGSALSISGSVSAANSASPVVKENNRHYYADTSRDPRPPSTHPPGRVSPRPLRTIVVRTVADLLPSPANPQPGKPGHLGFTDVPTWWLLGFVGVLFLDGFALLVLYPAARTRR